AAPLDGSDACFSLDSPRSIEACRRLGVDKSDLEERSDESFRQQPHKHHRRHRLLNARSPAARPGRNPEAHRGADVVQAIRRERHEINRHRLLREVKRERSNLVKGEQLKPNNAATTLTIGKGPLPRTPGLEASNAHANPKSPTGRAIPASSFTLNGGDSLSSVSNATIPGLDTGGRGRRCGNGGIARSVNPALEPEVLRLDALKRRRFAELKQMLAFELRSFAREASIIERDRVLAEKASSREAAAVSTACELEFSWMIIASSNRPTTGDRTFKAYNFLGIGHPCQVTHVEYLSLRRKTEQDRSRRRQAELAVERRAALAAEKAAILQRRIDRSVRVRRARQLRKERMAAERAGEREAAAEAAKRARQQESEKRKLAAAEKWATARAAVEEARQRRENEASSMRDAAGGKIAELEIRAASFRQRQKVVRLMGPYCPPPRLVSPPSVPRGGPRRGIEEDAKRKAAEVEAKVERERQISLAQEIRKQKGLARRRAEREEKEELRKGMVERKAKADEDRRGVTRRKLEQDTAKVALLRSEKERLKATRGTLASETAKQRKVLHAHFEALKSRPSNGSGKKIGYGEIVAAVAAAGAASTTPRGPPPPLPPSTGAHPPLSPALARAAVASSLRSSCSKLSGDAGAKHARNDPRPPNEPMPSADGSNGRSGYGGGDSHGRRGHPRSRSTEIALARKTVGRQDRKKSPSGGDGGVNGKMINVGFDDHAAAELRKRYQCHGHGSGVGTSGGVGAASGSRGAKQGTKMTKSKSGARRGNITGAASDRGGKGYGTLAPKMIVQTPSRPTTATAATTPTARGGEAMATRNSEGRNCVDDETNTAGTALPRSLPGPVSSPVPQPRASPSQPLASSPATTSVVPSEESDVDLIRGRYDRELLAILEEEQAAESTRERALAVAKARAKSSQARARSIGSRRRRTSDRGSSGRVVLHGGEALGAFEETMSPANNPVAIVATTGAPGPPPARSMSAAPPRSIHRCSRGKVTDRELQKRKEEEAAIATKEASRLEKKLAEERREASERILRVSEAYEKALERLS
ncbi:unnamed protein product, partial [Scytosiphon promiscuus]